jgi:hypothetical protein
VYLLDPQKSKITHPGALLNTHRNEHDSARVPLKIILHFDPKPDDCADGKDRTLAFAARSERTAQRRWKALWAEGQAERSFFPEIPAKFRKDHMRVRGL